MILGCEVTCPSCQQRDGTQRVSLLVNQISQKMTVEQLNALTQAMERGEAREWSGSSKNGSWEQLGKQLAPPAKPEVPSITKMTTIAQQRYAQFLTFFFIIGTLILFRDVGVQFGNYFVPIICVLWIAAVIGVWWLVRYARDAERNLLPKLEVWSRRSAKWNTLYYCARDNRIFQPGNPKMTLPENMNEILTA